MQLALTGDKKRLAIPPLAEFCCLATANRILRERELFFEPRGAWQILSKSALSARRARAEARSAEATNAEHTIWLTWRDAFRDYEWNKAFPDPEYAIKEMNKLLALV